MDWALKASGGRRGCASTSSAAGLIRCACACLTPAHSVRRRTLGASACPQQRVFALVFRHDVPCGRPRYSTYLIRSPRRGRQSAVSGFAVWPSSALPLGCFVQVARGSMDTARISSKGQVTVPKQVRTRLAVGPGDRLAFEFDEHGLLRVTPLHNDVPPLRGLLAEAANGKTLELQPDRRRDPAAHAPQVRCIVIALDTVMHTSAVGGECVDASSRRRRGPCGWVTLVLLLAPALLRVPDTLAFWCPATSVFNMPRRVGLETEVVGGVSTVNLRQFRCVLEERTNDVLWNARLIRQRRSDRVAHLPAVPPNDTKEAGVVPTTPPMSLSITMVEAWRLSRAKGVDASHYICVGFGVSS